jgi:FKBP-type peptidyl-prolyl cis-trans isomerase FklB
MRILTLILAFSWVMTTQAQQMDQLSYSLGVLLGQNLQQQGIDKIDASVLAKAIADVMEGKPLMIEASEANQLVQSHIQAQQSKKFEGNLAAGQAFLTENAKRTGVVTLPSGLQYEVMKPGTGRKPTASEKVTVHYHGTLTDGTVFDSSVDRGQPATFGVTQVIQGWVEALQLMPEGAKWKLFIPHNLAYGDRGAGPKIGPFATLVFEVELLKIN